MWAVNDGERLDNQTIELVFYEFDGTQIGSKTLNVDIRAAGSQEILQLDGYGDRCIFARVYLKGKYQEVRSEAWPKNFKDCQISEKVDLFHAITSQNSTHAYLYI